MCDLCMRACRWTLVCASQLAEIMDVFWAPLSALLVFQLYGNSLLSGVALVEELLPFTDIFPTATVGWILQYTVGARAWHSVAGCDACSCKDMLPRTQSRSRSLPIVTTVDTTNTLFVSLPARLSACKPVSLPDGRADNHTHLTHLCVPLQVIGKKLGMKIEPKPMQPNPRFKQH
jgi:hypothetical protein